MEDALDEMYKNVIATGRQGVMGKCPRCRAPFEKDGGCPSMSCTVCQYTYCWVCGMEEGTLHNIVGGPIMCGIGIAVSALPTWISIILHILVFIFLPLGIVLYSIAGAGYLALLCLGETLKSASSNWFCVILWFLFCVPLAIASFGVMVGVFIGLGIVAAYLSFTFITFRKICCIWLPSCCCCKRSRRSKISKKVTKEEAEKKRDAEMRGNRYRHPEYDEAARDVRGNTRD
jgi:hypothetical protein